MKKLYTILFLIIMQISLCFSGVYAAPSLPDTIAVGIYFGNSLKTQIELASPGGFSIGSYQERVFAPAQETGEEALVLQAAGENVLVSTAGGAELFSGSSVGIVPKFWDDKSGVITIDGAQYRDGVQISVRNQKLQLVNMVQMDHYLYGVISREMSPSWPAEALKAQAVCARNYAAQNLNKHKEQGFDLCNAVDCQAYSGMKPEGPSSYIPVDATSGQVLTYDGKIADLYYSASVGPRTENVKNVWGNEVPYLVSVENPYEDTENIPNGVWTGTLTKEEATTIMRNKGYDVGEVTSIKATEYSDAGRVLKLEVVGTNGTKVFEREACRTIFNTITKSQMFTVKGDNESGVNYPNISVTDGLNSAEQKIDQVVMLTAKGSAMLDGTVMYTTNGVYQQDYAAVSAETRTDVSNVYTFQGYGWGHGVGMSQYGAKGMAEAGCTYEDILSHYFVNTELETIY